jgi:hypothetical protein
MKPIFPVPTRVKILPIKDEYSTFLRDGRVQTERSVSSQIVRRFISVLFLPILMTGQLSATVLISVSSTEEVLLGSDGLAIRRNFAGVITGRFESCKIRQIGKFVVAHAGTLQVPDAGFNFWQIADEIVTPDATQFTALLSERLGDALNEIASYRRSAKPLVPQYTDIEIGVYIVEWQPKMNLIELKGLLRKDGSPNVSSNSVTSGIPRSGLHLVGYLGVSEAAFNSSLGELVNADTVESIRNQIRAQVIATPDVVGEPPTIVKINHSGPQWIERGNCQAGQ